MTRRPLGVKALTTAAIVLVLGGIGLAWQLQRTLSSRAGEDALHHFAPQNVAIAMTLDLHPSSMEQVQVMQRIQAAFKSEELDTQLQSSLRKWTKDTPLVHDMLPYLTGSGTLLLWGELGSSASLKTDTPNVLLAAGISKENEVVSLLKTYADRTTTEEGHTLYHVRFSENSTEVAVTLSDHYLLLGELSTLKQVFAVRSGKTKSLVSDPDFTRLRKTLPGDANLLCYISAGFVREAGKQSWRNDPAAAELLQKAQPACTSVTLRKEGIAFDSAFGGDAEYLRPIIEGAAIDPAMARRIPANALGLCIVAQPGGYMEAFEKIVDSVGGEAQRSWEKQLADFEHESHLRFQEDVIPALKGHLIMAAYPGTTQDSLDLLFLADTAHKANPARFADQVRDILTEQNPRLSFTSQEKNNATYWTLPESWKVDSIRSDSSEAKAQPGERVAQVDNALLFATSSDLLDKGVSAYRGGSQASSDTLQLPTGSKAVFVLHPKRILTMASSRIEELQKENPTPDPIRTDDLLDLCGDTPLIASAGYKDHYFTGSLRIPVRYETAAKLLRRVWNVVDKEQSHSDEIK